MFYSDTFFYKLNYVRNAYTGRMLEQNPDAEQQEYSARSIETLNRLITFVENGRFTNSKCSKYICRNWGLETKDLVKYYEKEFGKKKAASTFRVQRASISKQLTDIFGDDWAWNMLDDNSEQVMKILDALEIDDTTFYDTIYPLIKVEESSEIYRTEDLKLELSILKKYTIKRLNKELGILDKKKLAYIKRIMDKPLISSSGVNHEKIDVLRFLQG